MHGFAKAASKAAWKCLITDNGQLRLRVHCPSLIILPSQLLSKNASCLAELLRLSTIGSYPAGVLPEFISKRIVLVS